MALFSENLQQLQDLEDRYRQQLADYQQQLTTYRTLLDRDRNDPGLPKLYEEVEAKNRQVQETYTELERLRRSLAPGSGASSSLA